MLVGIIKLVQIFDLLLEKFNTHAELNFNLVIVKMTILFLSTLLVQKITEWKDPLNTLYFGGIIIGLSVMLIVFIYLLKNTNNSDGTKNHDKLS